VLGLIGPLPPAFGPYFTTIRPPVWNRIWRSTRRWRIGSFYAVINPEFPRLEHQVRQAAENQRVVGLRLVPALHHYDLQADRVQRTMALAVEYGLPVNLMSRVFDGRVAPRYVDQTEVNADSLATFLERNREARGILSMFFFNELKGYDMDWDCWPHVYLDLGCSKPSVSSLDELGMWFPLERVLFGTGAPFYYWEGSRLGLDGARITEEQKQAVMGGNAEQVFTWD
jgi:predicted TIM-barrel fold metal-dependent hydrolase